MKNVKKQMGGGSSTKLIRIIDEKAMWLYRMLPYTYFGMYKRMFETKNTRERITVLDLGCGDGSATYFLNLPNNYEITGVDIHRPYLKAAKKLGVYQKLINKDVRKFTTRKKYDIVIASHVLEHMTKKQGSSFIKKLESVAKKRVIIAAPIGELPQDEYDGNPYQKHKAVWTIKEMKNHGYSYRVHGLKKLWGNSNVVEKYGVLSYALFFLSFLSTPFLQFFPDKATYVFCYKDTNN
jgi:SAM-dependent methyltransferase